jgi:type I restriction enzyme S subunit
LKSPQRSAPWDDAELGDIVTLHRGYDLPSSRRRDGPIPVVSSSGITGYHDEAKIAPPGVITGRYGTLGEIFYIEEPCWPLNTTLYVSDFHGNDPRFVSYLLQCQGFGTRTNAAAVPGVNRNALHRLRVRRPPVTIQRRIAGILSAYDDLISTNRQRIKVLEEMARRTYHDWFVDFRYPGHELVPWVDTEFGPTPSGWETASLSEICELMQAGGTPSRSNQAYWTAGTKDWFTTNELQDGFLLRSAEQVTNVALADRKTRLFASGTILMAIYGSPTVGRLGILTSEGCCNQAALAMRSQESRVPQIALFYLLKDLRDHFNRIAQGAAQQNISKEKVAATRVLCPPVDLLTQWSDLVAPSWRLRMVLAKAMSNLKSSRTLLLPRLISGKVDVSDINIAMPSMTAQ